MNPTLLSHGVNVTSKTRRELETLARMENPDGHGIDADKLAERILRTHLDGIPRLQEMRQRITDFYASLRDEMSGAASDHIPDV